jgi:hypothetical protein
MLFLSINMGYANAEYKDVKRGGPEGLANRFFMVRRTLAAIS